MAQVLKDEIKLAIFVSAKEQFVKNGYDGSSMRKIASGAGVTAGNLYRYFTSKENLYRELIDDVVMEINTIIYESSGGLMSFKRGLNSSDSEFQALKNIAIGEKILERLNDTMIYLVDSYREEVSILLKTGDTMELYDDFSLTQWIADIFKVVFSLEHASYHLAFGLVKGLESILDLNLSPEETRLRATELIGIIAQIER